MQREREREGGREGERETERERERERLLIEEHPVKASGSSLHSELLDQAVATRDLELE